MKRFQGFLRRKGPVRERLLVLVPLVIAAVLVLGSSLRWVRTVNMTSRLTRNVGQMERDLEVREQFHARARQTAIEERHAELRERLVEGLEGCREWLTRVTCTAAHHGFRVGIKFGTGSRLPGQELPVDLVPLNLEFLPQNSSEGESCHSAHLIGLLYDLESDRAPLQVVELTLKGSGRGLVSASIVARLWVFAPPL